MRTPDHYAGNVQPIDAMDANFSDEEFIGFLRGNIVKYALRLGKKDGALSEAWKIQDYAERLVAKLGEMKNRKREEDINYDP